MVTGAASTVDGHATARADGQHALAGQLVARTDAGGEHDHVGLQPGAVGKHHAVPRPGPIGDLLRIAASVHLHAQLLNLGAQHAATAFIHLHSHQPRRELHHMRFQAHVAQCLGAFQAQQPTAHDHACLGLGAGGLHGLQILDGAIDEAVFTVAPRNLGHKRIGACGEHQLVIAEHLAIRGGDGAAATVDGRSTGGEPQRKTRSLKKAGLHQREVICGLATKELREMDPVVGGTRLFAQHGHFHIGQTGVGKTFEELLAYHAVADKNDFHAGSPARDPAISKGR